MPDEQQATTHAPEAPAAEQATEPTKAAETPPAAPKARDHAEFARRRQMLSEKARQVAERERATAERERALQAREAEKDKLLADMRAELDSWRKSNPLKKAQEAGVNLDEAIREFVQGDTPEAKNKAFERELAALRKELSERDAREKAAKEAAEKEGLERARQAARGAFVRSLTEDPSKFPYLNAEFDASQLAVITAQFDEWATSEGKTYTYEQAQAELERLAKVRYETRAPLREKLFGAGKAPPAPATDTGSGKRPPAQGKPAVEPTTRAQPAPKPGRAPNGRFLREDEEVADLTALRKAMESDRIAKANEGKTKAS